MRTKLLVYHYYLIKMNWKSKKKKLSLKQFIFSKTLIFFETMGVLFVLLPWIKLMIISSDFIIAKQNNTLSFDIRWRLKVKYINALDLKPPDAGKLRRPDPDSLTTGTSSVRFPRPNWPYPNYSLILGFYSSFPLWGSVQYTGFAKSNPAT